MYRRMRNIKEKLSTAAAHKAAKIKELGSMKIAAITAGIVIFVILNGLLGCVPLMILLLAGFTFGIRIDAPKIFAFCGILCSLMAGLVIAPALGGGILLALSVIPVVRYNEKRFIAFAVIAFDIFTGTLINSAMGWFLLLVEIIVLMAVHYRSIIDFMLDYIEYGTLGPIDDLKKKHIF